MYSMCNYKITKIIIEKCWFYGLMASTQDCDPSSDFGRT